MKITRGVRLKRPGFVRKRRRFDISKHQQQEPMTKLEFRKEHDPLSDALVCFFGSAILIALAVLIVYVIR